MQAVALSISASDWRVFLNKLDCLQEEDEGLISIAGGSGGAVTAAAPAPVTAPAAAVDEASSLLSHDEQQEAFFADPTANGAAPGSPQMFITVHDPSLCGTFSAENLNSSICRSLFASACSA